VLALGEGFQQRAGPDRVVPARRDDHLAEQRVVPQVAQEPPRQPAQLRDGAVRHAQRQPLVVDGVQHRPQQRGDSLVVDVRRGVLEPQRDAARPAQVVGELERDDEIRFRAQRPALARFPVIARLDVERERQLRRGHCLGALPDVAEVGQQSGADSWRRVSEKGHTG
jgi:hypothetical protein